MCSTGRASVRFRSSPLLLALLLYGLVHGSGGRQRCLANLCGLPACTPLAAARRGQDHSAYIPDHGRRRLLSLLLRLLPSRPRVVVPKHIVRTGCELIGLRSPSLDVSVCSPARAGSGCGSSRWLRRTRRAAGHFPYLRPEAPRCPGARSRTGCGYRPTRVHPAAVR